MRPRVQMAWCLRFLQGRRQNRSPLQDGRERGPTVGPGARGRSPETCASCQGCVGVAGGRQETRSGGRWAKCPLGCRGPGGVRMAVSADTRGCTDLPGSDRVSPPFKHRLSIKCLFWKPTPPTSALPVRGTRGPGEGRHLYSVSPVPHARGNAPESAAEADDKDIGCLRPSLGSWVESS